MEREELAKVMHKVTYSLPAKFRIRIRPVVTTSVKRSGLHPL
jgi:hypothetical protein